MLPYHPTPQGAGNSKLKINKGETILEIGFGTGYALMNIAKLVGKNNYVYGIDISPKMVELTNKKIKSRSLADRVKLTCGDALKLPYCNNKFDAIFLSFTLELFDTPEISEILKEIKRVLRSNGRLGVVSISKENGNSVFLKLYEWAHIKFPKYIDCRPIFAAESIKDAGFNIKYKKEAKIFFAPVEIVVSINK